MSSNEVELILHEAIKANKTNIIRNVLNRGAEFNFQNDQGDTPLHLAVRFNNVDIIKQLLERDVNVNIKNREGDTALHTAIKTIPTWSEMYATRSITLVIAKLLLNKGAEVDIKNNMGYTPLHLAIGSCKTAVINLLVDRGADVNVQNPDGNAALHLAIVKYHEMGLALKLFEKGVDLNVQNNQGDTPLHLSIRYSRTDTTNYLLGKAKINIQNDEGDTPLLLAYKYCKLSLISQIYETGGDVTITNREGNSSLHLAFNYGKIEINSLRRLLELGADLNVQNNDGNTPLHLAFLYCEVNYQEIHAKIFENEHIIDELLANGASVNVQNCRGETPLFFAANRGYRSSILKKLIDKGADVHFQNAHGDTLLHYATFSNNIDTIKFVADLNIDINAQNVEGNTPLHCAATSFSYYVEELIRRGADVLIKNKQGKTPYDVSHERSHSQIILGEHVIALKTAGIIRDIPRKISKCYENAKVFKHHKSACLNELNKLKTTKFINDFSLFDIVSRYGIKTSKLPYFLCDVELRTKLGQFFNCSHQDLSREFPFYWLILINTFECLKKTFQVWQSWKYGWNLPDLPVEKILNYMTASDMDNFIKSLPSQDLVSFGSLNHSNEEC